MAKKPPKNTVGRKPSKANLRKQSTPKTPQEEKQAIADDIKGDVIGYLRSVYMEQGIIADTMNRTLGQGGENLGSFIKQLERGYDGVNPKLERIEKEDSPVLKKLSQEAIIESKLADEIKSDGKNTSTKKPPKKS